MTILNYPIKRSALARAYRISEKTFKTWLVDIGISHTKTLSPADVKKIIASYDLPNNVEIKI